MDKIKTTARQFMGDSLYRNSLYLFMTNASQAATGFLFWAIAARLFPADQIGIISTIIAAATFIASASLFGLDHTLIHYLAKHKTKTTAIINTAFSVVTLGVLFFSVGYLCIVPSVAPGLAFILSSPVWVGAFIALMLATAWNNTLNSIFIAFRATHYILIAGLLFGIGRIVILAFFNTNGLASLFGAHFIAFCTGMIAGFIGIFIIKRYVFRPHIGHEVVRLIRGYSLRTYIASLLASLPPLLTPLFVLSMLGASEAAYYNMPFLVVGLLVIIPMATSQSLFAEGAHEGGDLKKHIIKSIKLIYILLIPTVIAVITAGYFVLSMFGANYAQHGYLLLVFLSLATLFKAGSFLLAAILRILGDIKEIIIATAIYVFCLTFTTYTALFYTGQLWTIGLAAIIAEAILLVIYTVMVQKRWSKITVTNTEIA